MSYANNDERTADLDEKFQDTHDRDADRADERAETFANSLFEFAKSTNDIYRTAYEAGDSAGYLRGFKDGAARAADVALKVIRRERE